MRTNEERIEAMRSRAAELMNEKMKNEAHFAGAVSAAFGVLFIILLAAVLSRSSAAPAMQMTGMSGSIFSGSGALGYIVIGIVAFMLGVSVTVFAFRLKKWRDGNASAGKEDTGIS